MSNVIALVTHSRPECLQIHLNQLLKNPELKDFLVHFFADYGFHPDVLRVIKNFRNHHKDIRITTRSEAESKRSPLPAFYNVFNSYDIAAKETDNYVLITEEDTPMTTDYLKYHIRVYENFLSKYDRIFCASTKRRNLNELIGNPELLIGDIQLCSPSIITKKMVNNILVPLMKDNDFWIPWNFNKKMWPNYRLHNKHHTHYDGQLERIAETHGLFSLKPDQARSAHIGVSGQHFRGKVLGSNLEEKVAYMESIMHCGEDLRNASDNPKDMCSVKFDAEPWDDLYLDLDRDKVLTQKADFDPNNTFKKYINEYNK